MKQKYIYIFFVEDDKVRTYCYVPDKKQFEIVKYNGCEDYPYSEKGDFFWTWWIKYAAYCLGYEVDFCFISKSKEHPIKNHGFKKSSENVWNEGIIKSFFMDKTDSGKVTCHLPGNNNFKTISFSCVNRNFGYIEPCEYYVDYEINEHEKTEDDPIPDNGEGAVYRHYKEIREKEKLKLD